MIVKARQNYTQQDKNLVVHLTGVIDCGWQITVEGKKSAICVKAQLRSHPSQIGHSDWQKSATVIHHSCYLITLHLAHGFLSNNKTRIM